MGEWETILTMQKRNPGHYWNWQPLWGPINEADPAERKRRERRLHGKGPCSKSKGDENPGAEASRVSGFRVSTFNFQVVDGPHGLRRLVEKLLPEFFPLHSGLTTGTCAAAASVAAHARMSRGEKPDEVPVILPNGEALSIADSLSIPHITLGVMLGKAVKLAQGHLDTHSKHTTMDTRFVRQLLGEANCPPVTDNITLARELWERIPANRLTDFAQTVIAHCYKHCAPLLPGVELSILLIDDEGNIYEL